MGSAGLHAALGTKGRCLRVLLCLRACWLINDDQLSVLLSAIVRAAEQVSCLLIASS